MAVTTIAVGTTGARLQPTGRNSLNILKSEWTKIRSVRSTYWTLAAAALTTVGLSAIICAVFVAQFKHLSASDLRSFDPASTSLTGGILAQFAIAVLGVIVITSEYGTGDVMARLAGEGIAAAATPYSPLGLRVDDKPALQKLDAVRAAARRSAGRGQPAAGARCGAKRGEMVVDFCAGAGGKTLALGAPMRSTGRLYAFDVSGHRLAALKPRLARSGLSNVHPVQIAHERDDRDQAPGRQDRPRAGRRAVLGPGHAAPQSRPEVAAVAARRCGTGAAAARDPGRRVAAGEARRPARLRDLQPARRRERGGGREFEAEQGASFERAADAAECLGRARRWMAPTARRRSRPAAVDPSHAHRQLLRRRLATGVDLASAQIGARVRSTSTLISVDFIKGMRSPERPS